ncbi:MAG: LysR family transcriptional regulator [Pyrinomonadaceae bacterium]|nr:LysR family transcriptional regulator [Pyrinomonadaceae bacterium]
MEIKQLRAFVAIAEARTFTAGAKRVNVTQAAISMQIRQLEEEVGIPLFTRTPRRVILTEAGEKLLERARKILREHDMAIEELAELRGAEHGRLRIGSSSSSFATEQLPEILQKLRKKFPKAEITVFSATSEVLTEKLLNGEIDIAFVSLPIENNNIQTELLYSDEIVAIAHPSHPLAKRKVITAAELANEPLILGEKGGNTRRLLDEFFAQVGVKPNIIMELSRQSAINRMVEKNMGVGIAGAKSVAKEVAEGKLVTWWIEGATMNRELGLAQVRGSYSSPILNEFKKLCKESFKEKEKEYAVFQKKSLIL